MQQSNEDLKKTAADLTKAFTEPVADAFHSKHSFTKSDISTRLENIDWFSQCGSSTSLDLTPEIMQVKTWIQAVKSSKKRVWENIELEARNQLTLFLSQNHREQYQSWNEILAAHKKTIIEPIIEQRIRPYQVSNNLDESVVHSVRWDILGALMENSYIDCGHNTFFFLELLTVYESGHFPCGWKGEWSEGKLIVF
ncbi:MAG: hypothetical protein AAF485_26085 [Chloroflexota bacterium]